MTGPQAPLTGFQTPLTGSQTPMAGPQTSPAGAQTFRPRQMTLGPLYGWMDVRRDGISPHSTGLRPLSGPLPKKAFTLYQNS